MICNMMCILSCFMMMNGLQGKVILHDDAFLGVNRMAYHCIGDIDNLYRGTCEPMAHLNHTFPRYRYKSTVDDTNLKLNIHASPIMGFIIPMPKFRCEIDGWITLSEVSIKCISRSGKKILYCIGNSERSTCVQTA